MKTREQSYYTGEILFEGSSSILGVGDDSGRGGFRGRLEHHYLSYTMAAIPDKGRNCRVVNTHGTGAIDRTPGQYAKTLGPEIDLISKKAALPREQRIIAVLGMGTALYTELRQHGGDETTALADYRGSLDKVRAACETRNIHVIGVGLPVPNHRYYNANGTEFDPRIQRVTAEVSEEHMSTWEVPSINYFPLQNLVDMNPDTLAHDGSHLNSAGYYEAATALVPMIDAVLEIHSTDLVSTYDLT